LRVICSHEHERRIAPIFQQSKTQTPSPAAPVGAKSMAQTTNHLRDLLEKIKGGAERALALLPSEPELRSLGWRFHDHPQRTNVAAKRRGPLPRVLFVFLNQLANCRVVVPQFERFSSSASINPKRFDDLRRDTFRGRNFFCSCTPENHSSRAIDRRRSKPDVPIIPAGWWTMQKEFPRCAANWCE
jgi:hypothetical protein